VQLDTPSDHCVHRVLLGQRAIERFSGFFLKSRGAFF
jgi:hypothetical protein